MQYTLSFLQCKLCSKSGFSIDFDLHRDHLPVKTTFCGPEVGKYTFTREIYMSDHSNAAPESWLSFQPQIVWTPPQVFLFPLLCIFVLIFAPYPWKIWFGDHMLPQLSLHHCNKKNNNNKFQHMSMWEQILIYSFFLPRHRSAEAQCWM